MKDIWPLLRRLTSYVPEHICLPEQVGSKFQVFEVLVTWLISEQNKEFNWKVTKVQGDGGIDFIGRKSLLQLPNNPNIVPEFAIFGQCKVRNQQRSSKSPRDDAFTQLQKDFRKSINPTDMSPDERPIPRLLVGCLVDKIDSKERNDSEILLSQLFKASATILDINEITQLICNRLDILSMLLDKSPFSPGEVSAIISYFQLRNDTKNIDFHIESFTDRDEYNTGEVLKVSINLSSCHILPQDLKVRYNKDNSNADLLNDSCGKHIDIYYNKKNFRIASCELLFRTYKVGVLPLGQLEITSNNNPNLNITYDLGEIFVEYSFCTPFFWWPELENISRQLSQYIQLFSQKTSCITLGLIGEGGSGKSRLLEELSLTGAFSNWNKITFRPSKIEENPLGLILDIACFSVTGKTRYKSYLQNEILSKLDFFNSDKLSRAKSSFLALTDSRKGTFDKENLALVVAALLRERSQNQKLILHIMDSHRTPREVFDFITYIAFLISQDISGFGNTIIFIIEGRVKSQATSLHPDFEKNLRKNAALTVTMPTLINNEEFLNQIFFSSQNPNHVIDHERTALFNNIKSKILKSCHGNPMFIIETIRLLVDTGYIRLDPHTGWLYLQKKTKEELIIPGSIEECLILRFKHIEQINPGLSGALLSSTLINDGIPEELFLLICEYYNVNYHYASLFDKGMLIKEYENKGEVTISCSHEFYFQTAQNRLRTIGCDKNIIDIYIGYIDTLPRTPQVIFDKARLYDLRFKDKLDTFNLLRQSLDKASRSDQGLLEYKISKYLIDLWNREGIKSKESIFNVSISLRHGELLLRYDDREEAISWLEWLSHQLIDQGDNIDEVAESQNIDPSYLRLSINISLANSMLNQFIAYKSIDLLEDSIRIVEQNITLDNIIVGDHERKMWVDLKVNAYDRLSCAYRIEGNIKDAEHAGLKALKLSKNNNNSIHSLHAIFDFGRLIALRDPQSALNYYDSAKEHLYSLESDAHRHEKMIDVSRISAKAQLVETKEQAKELSIETTALMNDISFSGFGLEIGALLLNLSAIFSFIDLDTSLSYAEEAINWNMERNYLEMLWKSHHNACVTLKLMGETSLSDYHARRCFDLIFEDDLQKRPEKYRKHRLKRYEPTLRYLSSIENTNTPNISNNIKYFCMMIPGWNDIDNTDFLRQSRENRPSVESNVSGRQVYYLF